MAPIPRKPALKKEHVIRPTRNRLPSRSVPISRRRLDLWSPMLCHPSLPGPRRDGPSISAAEHNTRHENDEARAEQSHLWVSLKKSTWLRPSHRRHADFIKTGWAALSTVNLNWS